MESEVLFSQGLPRLRRCAPRRPRCRWQRFLFCTALSPRNSLKKRHTLPKHVLAFHSGEPPHTCPPAKPIGGPAEGHEAFKDEGPAKYDRAGSVCAGIGGLRLFSAPGTLSRRRTPAGRAADLALPLLSFACAMRAGSPTSPPVERSSSVSRPPRSTRRAAAPLDHHGPAAGTTAPGRLGRPLRDCRWAASRLRACGHPRRRGSDQPGGPGERGNLPTTASQERDQ